MPDDPITWDAATMFKVSEAFKQPSSAGRLKILATLALGELTVSNLVMAFGTSQPTVFTLLKHLSLAGAIDRERRGHHIAYSLTEKGRVILNAAVAFARLPG